MGHKSRALQYSSSVGIQNTTSNDHRPAVCGIYRAGKMAPTCQYARWQTIARDAEWLKRVNCEYSPMCPKDSKLQTSFLVKRKQPSNCLKIDIEHRSISYGNDVINGRIFWRIDISAAMHPASLLSHWESKFYWLCKISCRETNRGKFQRRLFTI